MPSRRALLVWAIFALLSVFPQRMLERRLAASSTVRGSESAELERRVREEFASPFASTALLVISGLIERANVDSTRSDVRAAVALIASHAAVTELISPASSLDTILLDARRTTALAIVGIRSDYPHAIDSLRALSEGILGSLRRTHPALRLRWTGEQAVVEDLRQEGAREARTAELRALPVTLAIAFWAFGSITATMVAILAAGFAITVSLGAVGALSGFVEPSLFVRTIVPLIGFALTVDYSLYLRRCARVAAARSVAYRSVGVASLAVVIGLVGLVAAPTGELRSAAVGGMLAAGLAAIASISLTPWKPLPHAGPPAQSVRWEAWGRFVVRHPGAVLAACALPLLFLAREALGARLVTPMDEWMPAGLESADALADLARARREGVAGSLRVLLDLPRTQNVLSTNGWEGLKRAGDVIRNLPGVADVRSLRTIGTGSLLVARDVLPNRVRNVYVSTGGHSTLLDVVPSAAGGGSAAVALAPWLRRTARPGKWPESRGIARDEPVIPRNSTADSILRDLIERRLLPCQGRLACCSGFGCDSPIHRLRRRPCGRKLGPGLARCRLRALDDRPRRREPGVPVW